MQLVFEHGHVQKSKDKQCQDGLTSKVTDEVVPFTEQARCIGWRRLALSPVRVEIEQPGSPASWTLGALVISFSKNFANVLEEHSSFPNLQRRSIPPLSISHQPVCGTQIVTKASK